METYHEKDLSAEQDKTSQEAWIPEKDVHEARKKDHKSPACQRKKTFECVKGWINLGCFFPQEVRADLETV